MASHDDVRLNTSTTQPEPLPPVDWASIGQVAPALIPISPRQATDPLPRADVVIITWTADEWSALDQVFLGNKTTRKSTDWEWKKAWQPYARGAASYSAGPE